MAARIGRGSLIGIGAVILNGARIGEECLIGATRADPRGQGDPAALVVLGSPGKVMRQVTDRDLARMRESFEAYVSRGQHYARGFRLQRP